MGVQNERKERRNRGKEWKTKKREGISRGNDKEREGD